MIIRTRLLSLALLAGLAACGKTDSSDAAADSLLAAAPVMPKTPHVVGFDIGRQVDSTGRLTGGSTDKFAVGDTIVVSVRAQFTKDGDEVSGLLRKGAQLVDSIGVKLHAPDSTGFTIVSLRFAQAKPWAAGSYQIETFLGTTSQGIKEITVH
ncbi:MAG: hypothetical protein ABIZ70_04210 [Gemmatimonadales bacterium]